MEVTDKTIDYIIRTTWLAISKMYNEEASKFKSTMAAGFTLLSIDPQTGTSSTALGPKMGMEPTSLSRMLKNLELKGLIYRTPNPEDGRGVIIKLTEFGLDKRSLSRERVLTFNNRVKESVSPIAFQHFVEVNEAILNLVHNKKIYSSVKTLANDSEKKN